MGGIVLPLYSKEAAMIYYVYVKDQDGKNVLYGQSQDIFEANEIHRKAKGEGYEYVAIWGQSHKFLTLFAIISQTDCSYVYLSFLLV